MGLLSDPSLTPRSKLGRALAKHNRKICFLFYVIGIAWFVCLSHSNFNHGTYLSENALSPGLVYPEVKQDSSRLAQSLLEELRREQIEHKSRTPYSWIIAKMNQIGLETHVHNFTLNYPFTNRPPFHGKNIYGILRAPRIGSTEGIVFTAPYRSPTSVHSDITPSIPLLLAFADFARKKNYWAKDLVFLVTEQEQLGMQAWLKAYHEGDVEGDTSVLKSGSLLARCGALQAALNLEIQDFDIDYIDVKIEGLNGQLPNLDMFNLVQRITSREGISSGYKQTPKKKRRSVHTSLKGNLKHISTMLLSQATGVPTGNHGLFHRYRIEALTLEAVKRTGTNNNNNKYYASLPLLKTIEGISRSLNNLLERFHQSFFFYILVQNDRFVSIGDFIPSLLLLAGPLLIKAFLLWLNINTYDSDDESQAESSDNNDQNIVEQDSLKFRPALLYILSAVFLGFLSNIVLLDPSIRSYIFFEGVGTSLTITVLLVVITSIGTLMPFTVRLPESSLHLLHVGALVLLATSLIVVGLLNFALGFFLSIITVPLAAAANAGFKNAKRRFYFILYAFLLNPLLVIYGIVVVCTFFQFPELALKELLLRGINATMDSITFAFMDYIIYGNWLYTVATVVLFPQWILWWTLALLTPSTKVNDVKEKNQ